jgi:hypothetical protein
MQSTEEVLRIFDEWSRHYAPSNFIQNEKNGALLADYILKNYGLVSITYLSLAVTAIASQLDWVPEPKRLTVDEQAAIFQAKEFARIQKETLENSIPFSERVTAEKVKREKEAQIKSQTDARGQLAVAISGYQAYRINGGGIDYGTTEMVQKELRGVKCGQNHCRTLAVVQQIIQELPDHPRQGDVARVVEVLNARLK